MLKSSLLTTAAIVGALSLAACDQRTTTGEAERSNAPASTTAERSNPVGEGMPRGAPDRLSQNESATPNQGDLRGGAPDGERGVSGAPVVNPNLPGRLDADGRTVTGNDALATNPSTAVGFATRAAVSDMYEIESSRLALERSRDERVRQFAQMMVDHHTRSSNELKSAVNSLGQPIVIPTQLDTEHQQMMERLRTASAENFDATYKNQQVQVHERALELMRGYAGNGDTETLRALATRTQPIIEQHLTEARDMVSGVTSATPPRAQGGAAIPGGTGQTGAR